MMTTSPTTQTASPMIFSGGRRLLRRVQCTPLQGHPWIARRSKDIQKYVFRTIDRPGAPPAH